MRRMYILIVLLLAPLLVSATPNDFFQLSANDASGHPVAFEQYRGSVVLVVNTASKCGFTPQYKTMQEAYTKYKDSGLVVLAFPSSDFDDLELKSNSEIKEFCVKKYGVTFPLFEKGHVRGSDAQAVFRFLTEQGDENLRGEVEWNFEKFLVDRNGKLRARFSPFSNPMSQHLTMEIEELLKEG